MGVRTGHTFMKAIFIHALLMLISGCSILDFGGNDAEPFEIRTFWSQGPSIGQEDPNNPGFDKDGNKIPPPEVLATYQFPDIHAGISAVIQPKPRFTPTIGIELCEVKLPYIRWISLQAQGGADLASIYAGKRLTSIFEVTVGPWFGRDFREDGWSWGVGGTVIRF